MARKKSRRKRNNRKSTLRNNIEAKLRQLKMKLAERFDLNRNGRKWKLLLVSLCLVGVLIGSCVYRYNVIRGSYEGLGNQETYALNTYSASNFSWKNGLKQYDDDDYSSRNGIDVSAYQGSIDWAKVKKAGISFAMIRAGYRGSSNGKIVEDSRFSENLEGALNAGLDVGVYFYSTAINTDEAVEEAKWTLSKVKHKGITLPVAYDMEEDKSSRAYSLTTHQKTKVTDAFCSIVEQNGFKPLIYGNPTWINESLDLAYLSDYSLWVAHYTSSTTFHYQYVMWQYSQSGRLPGISTKVDMDILMVKK